MDWINTIKEALTVKRAFYISVIFAVATFAAQWIPQIEWRGKPLFDIPSWTWGVIGALVALLYFFLRYAHSQRMELVPKIKLSFDKDASCIVQTPEHFRDATGQKVFQKNATYVNNPP